MVGCAGPAEPSILSVPHVSQIKFRYDKRNPPGPFKCYCDFDRRVRGNHLGISGRRPMGKSAGRNTGGQIEREITSTAPRSGTGPW